MRGCSRTYPIAGVDREWWHAYAILIGIPLIQFIMLLGVVWFSGKAIILEPSYFTAAHLLYSVIHKLGHRGILMSVDAMTEMMGPASRSLIQ